MKKLGIRDDIDHVIKTQHPSNKHREKYGVLVKQHSVSAAPSSGIVKSKLTTTTVMNDDGERLFDTIHEEEKQHALVVAEKYPLGK